MQQQPREEDGEHRAQGLDGVSEGDGDGQQAPPIRHLRTHRRERVPSERASEPSGEGGLRCSARTSESTITKATGITVRQRSARSDGCTAALRQLM